MNVLLVAPILTPLLGATLSLVLHAYPKAQRAIGLGGALVSLLVAVALLQAVYAGGILVTQLGGWAAPFGITLVADLLSAIMVLLAALVGLAVFLYAMTSVDAKREAFGFFPLFQILSAGICGAFLTGDLFNLYVWFEVMLLASFVLLALGGERPQLVGAIKYVTLNLVASALFLAGVGIVYATSGTLNMADIAVELQSVGGRPTTSILAMIFLVAFGIKAAIFPLFFWLPDSYHTPPLAVSAVFAGLLTKVGVYALLRVFTLIFVMDTAFTHGVILVLACFTMIAGVLGAASQNEIRKVLSFHIVSQIGYMILGLGLYTRLALAGSVFYIIHHVLVKTNLFLVAGIVQRLRGSFDLAKTGGLYRDHPWVAVLFLIPALSLSGIPPLSGFFAKFTLLKAGLEGQAFVPTITALVVGLLTLYSMSKIWNEAFWKPAPAESTHSSLARPVLSLLPVVSLAVLTVGIGLGAGVVLKLAFATADQLLDPSQYIAAVLGRQR